MWEFLLSLVSGSFLGFIGGLVTRWMDMRKAIADQAHELLMFRERNAHERWVTVREWEGRVSVAKEHADAMKNAADHESLRESIRAEARGAVYYDPEQGPVVRAVMALVDAVRGLTRPGVTGYLVYAFAQRATTGQMVVLLGELTGVAIGWWFGSRGTSAQN